MMNGAHNITWLQHHRIRLALHQIAPAQVHGFRPLLILHGLGEESPKEVPIDVAWPGPIVGLDFTGHGQSTVPVGGGYTSEILVGDVDAALVELGQVTILGRGLGAYIALLATAARPAQVIGTILADGPGIAGGGVHPGSPLIAYPSPHSTSVPDPFALIELARDVRPPDYAQTYINFVIERSALDVPVTVSSVVRPEWLATVSRQPGVQNTSVKKACAYYADIESGL